MKDQSKTKQVLIQELVSSRQRIADLEKAQGAYRETEKAFRESEELYRMLVETSPDAILMYGLDGTILAVNKELVRKYGAESASEFHREIKSVFDLLEANGRSFAVKNFKRTIAQGASQQNEYQVRLRDGKHLPVEINSSVVRTADGKPRAFISVVRDISERKQAEGVLRENEEKYRRLIETTQTGFVIIDQDGFVLDANPEYVRLTGYHNLSEIVGRRVIEWTADHEKEKNATAVGECFRKGYIRNLKIDYVDSRGNITPIEINATRIESGGVPQILTLCRNITDRVQMEKALLESEERFRSLIQSLSDMIFVIDRNGQIAYESPSLSRVLGYDPGYFIGKSPLSFIHPDDMDHAAKELEMVFCSLNDGLPTTFRCLKADNTWIYLETLGSNHLDQPGIQGIVITARDITERKRVEDALRKSEAEKTVILESVSDMIFFIDTDMRVIYSNLAMEKFFSLPSGFLEGKVCYHALHHRDKPCRVCPALKAMQSGKHHESYVSSLGRHWRLSGYPVRDENGMIVGAIEAVSDITDLRNMEEKYRSIFDNAMEGIYQSTLDGRLISVNPALARIFGYDSPETMMNEVTSVGQSLYADPDRRQEFLRLVDEQGIAKNFEFEGSKKDGERIYVSDSARAVKDSQGNTIYFEGIIQDITDRKRAEESLRDSEARYTMIMNNITDRIWLTDMNFKITWASESVMRDRGYQREEIKSFSFEKLLTPDSLETVLKTISEELTPQRLQQKDLDISKTLELEFLRKDGSTFWSEVKMMVLRDHDGTPRSILGVGRDITDRKRAEEEKRILEERLQHADKMESIGTLAGGIAHDFNNLLMGIQGYASLMLLDLDASHPHYERLKRVEQQVQSGADLTKQLLGFARGGRYEVRPTDMNDIIDRTSSMFGRTKKEIAVHRSLAGDLWIVDCDQGQMEQVLMNLYVNAWQAMPGGGELYLQTGNVLLGDDHAKSYTIKPGRYVKITFTDTGTGMDEKTRERIFDPFFTTKEMGRGTGLGLAMVYGIIKGHGGMIDVTSEPGQGTTFDIYLPASEKRIVQEKPAVREILTGTETVLLVDDEQMVMEVTRKLLESLGYRVYAVGSGQEAIAVYVEKRTEIDMVILDMIMPGISGGETFDRLREINPEIRVLLSSGYSIEGQARQILERGCNGFLQKPFHLENLSRKVREVLSE